MMARRGLELAGSPLRQPALHQRARGAEGGRPAATRVSEYAGPDVPVYRAVCPWIQEEILAKCPEEYFTLIMRRFMMRVGRTHRAQGGLRRADYRRKPGPGGKPDACRRSSARTRRRCMPVFRPLIGMDKIDIVAYCAGKSTHMTSPSQPYRGLLHGLYAEASAHPPGDGKALGGGIRIGQRSAFGGLREPHDLPEDYGVSLRKSRGCRGAPCLRMSRKRYLEFCIHIWKL